MNFWDSSALVRCFQDGESGHLRMQNLIRQRTQHSGSVLLLLESAAALDRIFRHDSTRRRKALEDLDQVALSFYLSQVTPDILVKARTLVERHFLRGSDALHIATALKVSAAPGRRRLVFISGDEHQARSAAAEGLRVLRPDA